MKHLLAVHAARSAAAPPLFANRLTKKRTVIGKSGEGHFGEMELCKTQQKPQEHDGKGFQQSIAGVLVIIFGVIVMTVFS